jgi:flagellar motor component MotA
VYQTNAGVHSFADTFLNEMRNLIPLIIAAMLLMAACAMFLTGIDDIASVIAASLVVLTGTVAALLLTFSRQEVAAAMQAAITRGIQHRTAPSEMITMITMLSDLSRRVGLVGLVDIRTSSSELREVCALIAGAADEVTIRMQLEKRRIMEIAAHKMVFSVLVFAGVYAVVLGMLGSIVQFTRMQSGSGQLLESPIAISLLPLICGLSLALFVVILIGRINVAHLREMVSLEIAYQGGAMILEDNNAERVKMRLADLLPPGME